MAHIEVLRQKFGSYRYAVHKDDGTTEEKKAPVAEVDAERRRTHKSLASVLAKREGLDDSQVTVIPMQDPEGEVQTEGQHTHAEFSLPVPEHDHEYAPLNHDHSGTIANRENFERLQERVLASEQRTTSEIKKVAAQAENHEHRPQVHKHELINAQLEALETSIASLTGRPVQEHGHKGFATATEVSEGLAAVRRLLSEMREEFSTAIAGLRTELSALSDRSYAPLVHDHSYAESNHKHDPGRGEVWRELSRQEVGGKDRLVVERVQ